MSFYKYYLNSIQKITILCKRTEDISNIEAADFSLESMHYITDIIRV